MEHPSHQERGASEGTGVVEGVGAALHAARGLVRTIIERTRRFDTPTRGEAQEAFQELQAAVSEYMRTTLGLEG